MSTTTVRILPAIVDTKEAGQSQQEAILLLTDAVAELAAQGPGDYRVEIVVRRMPTTQAAGFWESIEIDDVLPGDRIRFIYLGGTVPGERRTVDVYDAKATGKYNGRRVTGWDLDRSEPRMFKAGQMIQLERYRSIGGGM